MHQPPQSVGLSSTYRVRPASIAEILQDRYGEAYAHDWLVRQREHHEPRQANPSPPFPEPIKTLLRRPERPEDASLRTAPAMGPASLSEAATAPLRGQLHATAFRIYQALHRVAVEVAAKRGYSPGVTIVTYHLPTELLAFELGMSRTTLWTPVKALKAGGLIDQRAHTTTARGQRVKDGSLWSVRLDPKRGKRPRLRYDELSHAWRDLESDIKRGSTVYRHVEQSKSMNKKCVRYMVLVDWALAPGSLGTPVSMTVQKPTAGAGIEALLDLPHAPKNERNAMVDTAANAVAAYLGDANLDFYRYLAWQLLRRHDQGDDRIHTIYEMILRAGTDRSEGFARNAGALLTSRLKATELWDWIREAPPLRVGSPPLRRAA